MLLWNTQIYRPQELAVKITDEQQLFVSESSVYRILKSRGLIAPSPHTFIVAADQFHTKTKLPNEMWQTDFTYFKIKGWGWYFLSTILDDYSRYIVHHELCSTMKAEDVRRRQSDREETTIKWLNYWKRSLAKYFCF